MRGLEKPLQDGWAQAPWPMWVPSLFQAAGLPRGLQAFQMGLACASHCTWHSKSLPTASLRLGLAALCTIWSLGTAAHSPYPSAPGGLIGAQLSHARPAASLTARTPGPGLMGPPIGWWINEVRFLGHLLSSGSWKARLRGITKAHAGLAHCVKAPLPIPKADSVP